MLKVYGVVRADLLLGATELVRIPASVAHRAGGQIVVDADVSVVVLADHDLVNSDTWPWREKSQGYVLASSAPVSLLKNHLRGIRRLQDEEGRLRAWPWFDPRYLRLALSALEGPALKALFGPIACFGLLHEGELELIEPDGHLARFRSVS
jgi:hypothetical protein